MQPTSAKPYSSIVIVNHNSGRFLKECIESVRASTDDYEILLIDNNSTDDSLRLVAPGPDLKLIKLPQNVGFARANNIGIKMSSGRAVILLNADTVVTKTWLKALIEAGERSQEIGLVTPKLLRTDSSQILDSTGHVFQYQTGICWDRGRGQRDVGQYDNRTELPSCCFACVLVKKRVFEQIGLLDEAMFIYFEDVDFCLRARSAGWRVVFDPNSIVYHHRGGTTTVREGSSFGYWSRGYPLRIILKTYTLRHSIQFGGRSFLHFFAGVLAGLKNADWYYAKSNVRAITWNIARLPLAERIRVRRLRRISDEKLFVPRERIPL